MGASAIKCSRFSPSLSAIIILKTLVRAHSLLCMVTALNNPFLVCARFRLGSWAWLDSHKTRQSYLAQLRKSDVGVKLRSYLLNFPPTWLTWAWCGQTQIMCSCFWNVGTFPIPTGPEQVHVQILSWWVSPQHTEKFLRKPSGLMDSVNQMIRNDLTQLNPDCGSWNSNFSTCSSAIFLMLFLRKPISKLADETKLFWWSLTLLVGVIRELPYNASLFFNTWMLAPAPWIYLFNWS